MYIAVDKVMVRPCWLAPSPLRKLEILWASLIMNLSMESRRIHVQLSTARAPVYRNALVAYLLD